MMFHTVSEITIPASQRCFNGCCINEENVTDSCWNWHETLNDARKLNTQVKEKSVGSLKRSQVAGGWVGGCFPPNSERSGWTAWLIGREDFPHLEYAVNTEKSW